MPTIDDCKIIQLPKISETRGNLPFIEGGKHLPFDIMRVFSLYDVPGGESRAEHANTETEQFLIAMMGSFDVTVYDGSRKNTFHLNRAYYGLYIPRMIWRGIDNFSSGAVCLVLASTHYSADDYVRDPSLYGRMMEKGVRE